MHQRDVIAMLQVNGKRMPRHTMVASALENERCAREMRMSYYSTLVS